MGAQPPALGRVVLHRGRQYVVRGFSRMSQQSRQYLDLEDQATHDRLTVPMDEVSELANVPPRAESPTNVVPLRPDA